VKEADYALLVGGFVPGQGEVAEVEAWDGARVRTGLKLKQPRNGAAAVQLHGGNVLVTGGFVGGVKDVRSLDGQATASCELYVRR
jgi:hypothetical protein